MPEDVEDVFFGLCISQEPKELCTVVLIDCDVNAFENLISYMSEYDDDLTKTYGLRRSNTTSSRRCPYVAEIFGRGLAAGAPSQSTSILAYLRELLPCLAHRALW